MPLSLKKKIEIAKDQLRQEGKPEAMLDNIAKGKIKRFFKDNTLSKPRFYKRQQSFRCCLCKICW